MATQSQRKKMEVIGLCEWYGPGHATYNIPVLQQKQKNVMAEPRRIFKMKCNYIAQFQMEYFIRKFIIS